jgi:hypothetical protein
MSKNTPIRRVQERTGVTPQSAILTCNMGLLRQLQITVRVALAQLAGSTSAHSTRRQQTQDLSYTKNFYAKAKAAGLTEADARAVYYSGCAAKHKQNMLLKDYNGYSVGIYYFLSPKTGKPVISSIWKNVR